MSEKLSLDDVRALVVERARACEEKPWRSTGVAKWCKIHSVNRGHTSGFLNGKRLPTEDVLRALGLEWQIHPSLAPIGEGVR